MKRTLPVALLLLIPAGAFAQMGTDRGRNTNFEIGLRTAYAMPFGKATDSAGDDLNQTIRRDVPVTLDLNYRFSDAVYAGGYLSYGFAALGSPIAASCASNTSCSARTMRLGLAAYYHLSPVGQYDPWLGASVGYEQATLSASGPGGSSDATISGFELMNLQLGFDYRASSLFAVGPFVSAGVGQYTHMEAGSTSGSISNTALHGWVSFGLRMSFMP